MTTLASIVERFSMPLDDAPQDRGAWFLDYVLRSPKQAGKHLTAGWLALSSLAEVYPDGAIESCVEYFGGMGAQAEMVEDLFHPLEHTVQEWNLDAVAHLESLGFPATVRYRDAYDPESTVAADLVMLDFGDLTVWKTREGEKHRELLDRVFALQPKAVVFTDIACRYMHLHRERYESLLGVGTCASYETYLLALLSRFEDLYGYTLVRGYMDRWSTVMALVPMSVPNALSGELTDTPDSPVGLELL